MLGSFAIEDALRSLALEGRRLLYITVDAGRRRTMSNRPPSTDRARRERRQIRSLVLGLAVAGWLVLAYWGWRDPLGPLGAIAAAGYATTIGGLGYWIGYRKRGGLFWYVAASVWLVLLVGLREQLFCPAFLFWAGALVGIGRRDLISRRVGCNQS